MPVNMNMKMSSKLAASFMVMTVLVIACGMAGYYGVGRLTESLEYVTGPAWDTADGSMEGMIGVQGELIAVNRLFNGLDSKEYEKEMAASEAMSDEALSRMMASGLLGDDEIQMVKDQHNAYAAAEERVDKAFIEYDTSNKSLDSAFYEFQKLMTLAEEVGDSAVEDFKNHPSKKISWNTGLEEKWSAADGAMEAQIGLLGQMYHYKRLISGADSRDSIVGMEKSKAMMNESMAEIISHPLFRTTVITGQSIYAGMKYADAIQAAAVGIIDNFSVAVDKYQVFADAREAYEIETRNFVELLGETEEVGDSKVEGEMKNINNVISFSNGMIIFVSIIAAIIAGVMGFLILRGVNKQLGEDPAELVKVSDSLAMGDLAFKRDKHAIGVYGAINSTVEKLIEVISGIMSGANEVSVAAEQVSMGNANLSQRTQEQASSLEEVASSMEEMTSTVNQNTDNAQKADELARKAAEQASAGGEVVNNAIDAMNRISHSSSQIADIISVIDEIAFQTNLLALNAAVEAARAGDQGRGFAVVANEVRNLAGRSATAAKEIKELIQDSVSKVEHGTQLVDKSGEALDEIVSSVKKVSEIVAEIAAASKEQSSGIGQVNLALVQMDEMTQQNASLVEEAAAASETMGAQAQELAALVSFFNIDESAIIEGTRVKQVRASTKKSLGHGKSHTLPEADVSMPATARPSLVHSGSDEWHDF